MTFISRSVQYLKRQLSENTKASNYNIPVVGLIGTFGHPAYWVWWTYIDPQPNESLLMRVLGVLICAILWVHKWWPKWMVRFLPEYYFVTVAYTLPFFFTYYLISSHYSMLWSMAEIAMIFFSISVLPSFIIWLLNLIVGISAAIICAHFYITEFTAHFIYLDVSTLFYTYLPVFLFTLTAGVAISYSNIKGIVALKNIAAQERNKTLQALAGSIAHEIRNPLGQVKACLDGIEHTMPIPTNHETQSLSTQQLKELYEFIAIGQSAVKRGSQIISMTLAEVKSKSIDTTHFTYLPAVQTTQKAIAEYAYETIGERKKIRIEVIRDFMFKGEETLYIFVLFNLIKNALYYFKSNPHGRITIKINQPTITVHDTGPGISEDRLLHLFESFETYGKKGGTGLGLAYCKRVMLAFGGDIYCQSMVGQYTEFTLHFPEIPQATWDAYQQSIMQQAQPVFNNKHILVVDDDEILRLITQDTLLKLGARVEQAENGQIALDKIAHAHYDLIIMDLNMPVLDGYATTERIRTMQGNSNQHIPIVAYTTESAYMAHIKTEKIGMNGFISKPCEPLQLIQALQKILTQTNPKNNKQTQSKFSGKTVLVADDSEINRSIIKHELQAYGVQVLEANNGLEAIDQLELHPDCNAVLMDIRMPGMDGLQATRVIRSKATAYRTIPIIALTGDSHETYSKIGHLSGMNDFVTKPIDSTTLYKILFKYFDAVDQTTLTADISVTTTSSLILRKMETHYASLFNLERLEKFKQMKLLEKCTESFERQSTEYLSKLAAATKENNLAAAEDALHFLKGSSLTIGAKAFGDYTAEIYQEVLEGQWPSQSEWLEHITALHTKTISALHQYGQNA